MKKKIVILTMVLLYIIFCRIPIFAVTATANLNPSKLTVKPGEVFTVTLSVTCQDGINGVIGIKYNYDKDKLDLVSEKNGNNFFSLMNENSIFIMTNSTEKIVKADVYILEFKAKETITAQTTVNISVDDLLVDSDIATDSRTTVKGINTIVTIKPEETSSTNTTENTNNTTENINNTTESTNNTTENINNTTENTNNTTESTNNTTENTNNTTESTNNTTEDSNNTSENTNNTTDNTSNTTENSNNTTEKMNNTVNSNVISNTENNINRDKTDVVEDLTKSNSKLPHTGIKRIITVAILIISIISCAIYMTYRKYNNI